MITRIIPKTLVLAVAAGLLFSACSSSAASQAPATAAPATAAPATAAPATAAPASEAPSASAAASAFGCTAPAGFAPVWYASAAHPYFDTVKPGVEAAGKEFGFSPILQIGPDWTQDSENQGMQALFAKGSRYFSVYPSDANGANALYQELTDQGGPSSTSAAPRVSRRPPSSCSRPTSRRRPARRPRR